MIQGLKKYWFEIFIAPVLVTYFSPLRLDSNIAIAWLVVGGGVHLSLERDWNWKNLMPLIPMIAFFVLHVVGIGWSEDLLSAQRTIEMRVAMLVIPLAFAVQGKRISIDKLFNWLTVLAILGAIGGMFIGLLRMIETGESQWLYNDNVTNYLGFQAVYYAHLINLILIFQWNQYFSKNAGGKRLNSPMALGLVFLMIFQFFLACRVPIMLMFFVLGMMFVRYMWQRWRGKGIALVVLAMAAFSLSMWFASPKTFNRFQTMFQTDYDYQSTAELYHFNDEFNEGQWTGSNLRLAIWNSIVSSDHIPIVRGVGTGDKMSSLLEIYQAKDFKYAIDHKMGVHNQYLEMYVTFGLLGIVALLAILVVPIARFTAWRDAVGGLMMACFAIGFLTEDMLNRNQGIVLFSIITAVYAVKSNQFALRR